MKLERFILWFLFVVAGFLFVENIWDWYDVRNTVPKVVTARGSLAGDELNTMDIFSNVSPSVVSIATSKRVRDFWRRNVYSVPAGSGSGFIWDDKGHVVTNYHVIKDASSATITLNDNREYQASFLLSGSQALSPIHRRACPDSIYAGCFDILRS